MGKNLNSRQYLNQILVIDPEEPYVNFLLAQTCDNDQELDEKRSYFDIAIEHWEDKYSRNSGLNRAYVLYVGYQEFKE